MYKKNRSESGAVLLFVSLFLVVIIGSLSYTINLSRSRALKSSIQTNVDGAAQIAASSLCSTKNCYEEVIDVATELVKKNLENKYNFAGINFLDRTTLEWKNSEISVEVKRGRWWTDDSRPPPATDTSFFHPPIQDNTFFEDLDARNTLGKPWQAANSETPAFLVANALYLKVKVNYKNSIFNIFDISDTPVEAEVYALAGEINKRTCVAPFAIPVCSLLNGDSELDKQNACVTPRIFTESKRYCDEGDDCDVLPGSLYSPFPVNAERPTDAPITNFKFYDSTRVVNDAIDPLGSILFEHAKVSCNFPTRSAEHSISDHYGVVGMPLDPNITSIYGTTVEEVDIQSLLVGDSGCIQARIGDKFNILHDGLTEIVSKEAVWDRINNQLSNLNHPNESYNTMFSDEFERSIFSVRLPQNPNFFGSSSKYQDLLTSPELQCSTSTTPRYGLCNSQRFHLDSKCLAKRGVTATTLKESIYTPEILPCPNVTTDPPLNSPITGRKSWSNSEIYENSPVWKTAIPIISTANEEDRYCEGMLNDSAKDPLVAKDKDYFIIGFIDMIFYDTDIATAPPTRLNTDPKYAEINLAWDNLWDSNEKPWSFSKTTTRTGKTPSCNSVTAMVDCKQGLLSTPQFKRLHNRKVKLIVP